MNDLWTLQNSPRDLSYCNSKARKLALHKLLLDQYSPIICYINTLLFYRIRFLVCIQSSFYRNILLTCLRIEHYSNRQTIINMTSQYNQLSFLPFVINILSREKIMYFKYIYRITYLAYLAFVFLVLKVQRYIFFILVI